MSTQGVIALVDRTNVKDVTFSLLDHMGTSWTFHLTSKTHFAAHQSASQLAPNLVVRVNGVSTASGDWNATMVHLQQNTASLALQGVVAAIHTDKTIDLALTDGTVAVVHLSSSTMKAVHAGMQVAVQATFTSSGQLQTQQVRILAIHSTRFQVSGVVNHINARTHRLSLLTPQGSTFSILQPGVQKSTGRQAIVLHIGEKVTISGTTDSQGNLDEQQVTVKRDQELQVEVIGTITAIDTIANTISIVDQDGNVTLLNTSTTLLASLQVGNTYQFSVTLASDGTLTVVKIDGAGGSDQKTPLNIDGVVQSYDANSNVMSLLGEDDQIFSLQVTNQTTITGDTQPSPALQQGQAVKVEALANADGTFTALAIEIRDTVSQGDPMTFVGTFQSYDSSGGQLTLTLDSSVVVITTTTRTQVEGIASLSTIPPGSRVKVNVQIQHDGSYLALVVEAKQKHDGGDHGGDGTGADHHRK